MNKISIHYPLFSLLVVLTMMLVTVQPAFAQEATEIEITGAVSSIDEAAGSFTVETEEGESYTVFPDEGFDFSTIAIGDVVEVKGTQNEDGTVSGSEVKVEEDGLVDEEDDPSTGYYCVQSDEPHPFGAQLSENYEVDYATLQGWFCDGFGWGQVMLALQTSQITGGDPGELLELRLSGSGWGEIWQDLKLIGRPEHAGPPNDENGDGKPDWAAGPPDGVGDGKPDWAGPPDGVGDGKPDWAGPPDGVGPPADRP